MTATESIEPSFSKIVTELVSVPTVAILIKTGLLLTGLLATLLCIGLLTLCLVAVIRLIRWGALLRPGNGTGSVGWSKDRGFYAEMGAIGQSVEDLNRKLDNLSTGVAAIEDRVSALESEAINTDAG